MVKSIKLRIYPNKTQLKIINRTLGACNFAKNEYLKYNKNSHDKGESFITGYDFSKILNKLKKEDIDYLWLNEISSKAIKDAIMAKEKAYRVLFKKKKGFPKFKSRKRINKESYFFIKDNIRYISKNIIKLPILKKVRIINSNQLPDKDSITSGRIVRHYDKYYVMFIYNDEFNDNKDIVKNDIKLGIDLGIKDYATIYDGNRFYRINHFKDLDKYKKLTERKTKLQQVISKKAEYNYGRLLNNCLDTHKEVPNETQKKKLRKDSYKTSNIRRIYLKINKINRKLTNIRDNYIKQLVNWLTARLKPYQINIEDLDISDMIENDQPHGLHRLIAESNFYKFRLHLINKCKEYGIKLVLVDQYYPSTQICSCCGKRNTDIKLSDRIFRCDKCGLIMDRDENSGINITNCKSKYYTEIA